MKNFRLRLLCFNLIFSLHGFGFPLEQMLDEAYDKTDPTLLQLEPYFYSVINQLLLVTSSSVDLSNCSDSSDPPSSNDLKLLPIAAMEANSESPSSPSHSSIKSRLHRCSICEKIFLCQSKLARHLRVHTGEKPFECKVCFTNFTQKSSRTLHTLRQHPSEIMLKQVVNGVTREQLTKYSARKAKKA